MNIMTENVTAEQITSYYFCILEIVFYGRKPYTKKDHFYENTISGVNGITYNVNKNRFLKSPT